MNMIVIAVVSVTAIGAVCAAMLSVADKLMAVKTDERVARIEDCLPGTNCGACGFPGCSGYAAALVSGNDVKTNLCTPGGASVVKQLSEILGVEAGEATRKIAVVHCKGGCTQLKKMDYNGIQTCMASKQLFGGAGACTFGCLGYGDCQPACPHGAICMENGIAQVIAENCTGCGLCVKACPNQLITIDDVSETAVVLCKNIEKGAVARKKCTNACIGCRKCARECPAGAITIEDNLAKIDYEKCTHCEHCAEICVTHCIQLLAPQARRR
ncbi:MAG: RnfABCDGE type electron transport complex subunit B [Oscillospiraceae bacterium]|jgi:Na+-translocating ferredoxin:NAD+ oxidoreductase RNF subunit RnfB|nr:RnfABCDGE type electron transport complex subunit B [Oscillospiraceae bacterium]